MVSVGLHSPTGDGTMAGMANVLATHVRVTLQVEVGPAGLPLSDLQWLLSRLGRLFELSAWVADPGMLTDPERADTQAAGSRIPRLPVRYTTGLRPEADPQLVRVTADPSRMTYLLPHTMLWALVQLLRGAPGSDEVITLSVPDATLWSLQEMRAQPDRTKRVQDEFTLRVQQVEEHFG